MKLPASKFHRQIGMWSTVRFTPDGEMVDQATFDAKAPAWTFDSPASFCRTSSTVG